MREDLALLSSFIEERPQNKVRLLLVPDLPVGGPEYVRFSGRGGVAAIPIRGLQDVDKAANL